MNPIDPDEDGDARLRALFREAAFPPTPRFEIGKSPRSDERSALARWGAGLAVAAMVMVGFVLWRGTPQDTTSHVIAVRSSSSTESRSIDARPGDWPERVLFSIPPVDSLDVLADQQAAYLTLLQHIE